MAKNWNELQPEIARIVFREGVKKVADAIPADRATVYRMLNGNTQQPSRAVQAGVERIVTDREESKNG